MLPTVRLSGFSLSQTFRPLTIVVVDPRGVPFSGAEVTLQGASLPSKTDSRGVVTFPAALSGEAVVQVQVGDFTVKARGPADQTLFVTVPICSPGPLITIPELGALVLGGAAAIIGMQRKNRAIETLGEVLIGAGIFTAVYRHSCRW